MAGEAVYSFKRFRGLGFGVQGLGFRGLGFRGLGFGGLGFGVQGLGFRGLERNRRHSKQFETYTTNLRPPKKQ